MFTPKFIKALYGLIFIILLLSCSGCRWPRRVNDTNPSSSQKKPQKSVCPVCNKRKPRVLIFSCVGGGGHMSAAQAITTYLGKDYDVSVVNIIAEVAGNFDILRFISGNTVGSEDLYNFFLRHGMSRTVSIYCSLGHALTSLCSPYLDARVGEFLDHNNPDIVISVMPFFNGVIYRTTHERHIPFAVVTCDLNTVNYIQDLYNPTSPLFRYCLPLNEPAITETIKPAQIPDKNIQFVGFPVRQQFLIKRDKQQLREEFNFPANVPTIMILMGAAGGRSTLGYLRKLVQMKTRMHVVVCVGRNEALKAHIESIVLPAHMSVSVFGYTDKIAELMQASDALITKPGPTSICEALYVKIPLLLDGTSQPIFWETMNVDFVVNHGFGEVITSLRHVPVHVKKILENDEYRKSVIDAMEQLQLPDVRTNIPNLIRKLLEQARQGNATPCSYETASGGTLVE